MSASLQHLSLLGRLLQQELDYERDTYSRMRSDSDMAGRASLPWCRYPVSVASAERNALDQLIVNVSFDDNELDDNEFEPGKPAAFFFVDNDGQSLRELPFTAFVETVAASSLQLSLPNLAALSSLRAHAQTKLLGLQLTLDVTSYNVMFQALRDASASTSERFVQLREALIGDLQPRFRQLQPIAVPWLNADQQQAINKAVQARDVAIIHGPPGTGKTTTLIEAILETLQREPQVLVCAPSNAAVDWISTQLHRRGAPVLRIGNPLRMTDEMLECSYERRYAAHPDYPELWNIRKALRQANVATEWEQHSSKRKAPKEGRSRSESNRLHALRNRQTELEIRIHNDLFLQARVVSCTLIGSAYHIMEHRHFATLFIDEAAQALEPACWVAILKADRVILGGDHQQLPPTVKCPQAARNGLATTLMQHLAHTRPSCVSLLTTQYRMNRDIMDFPSRWFYHGALRAAPEVADRLVNLMDTPLTWVDTSQCGFAERQNRSLSRVNTDEARLVIHTLRDYVDMIGLERLAADNVDFGIISPYRAQVRLIRRLLKMHHFYRRLRRQISVNTVDGFQGQERDVIIISMVRDNDSGQLGFLNDLRRMNVAITRARMKLIVIGNADTLSRHPFYAALIDHFRARGLFLAPQPDPSAPDTNTR